MTVPITSDLAGYAAFWMRVVECAAAAAGLALLPIYVLLWRIWKK